MKLGKYNTETATLLDNDSMDIDDPRGCRYVSIYQTAGGDFFTHMVGIGHFGDYVDIDIRPVSVQVAIKLLVERSILRQSSAISNCAVWDDMSQCSTLEDDEWLQLDALHQMAHNIQCDLRPLGL